MTTENQTTIYIATHNITGLKYFGKTDLYFTEADLQHQYHGSGSYWKNHLKKHGDNVTMRIITICNINEVMKIATDCSIENSIVESNDWANLIIENGLDGKPKGLKHYEETIQ